MTGRRVAVTGVGVVCALGRNRREFWQSLLDGRSGIAPLASLDAPDLEIKTGAVVRDFAPREHFDRRTADLLDRFAQFALVAAREAVADAGIVWTEELTRRSGVVTGSSLGGKPTEDAGFRELYGRGRKRLHPMTIPRVMANAGASQISTELGLTGPSFTLSTACSSANHAIGQAFWLVRQGVLDVALAGGSEAPFTYGSLKAWEALRVVSRTTCRPFCRDRDGMILGEGGAILVLEPLEVALARGVPVYAEIAGFGMSADAHHVTQGALVGPVAAMRAALADADLPPESVDYINAHGTGTLANDPLETRAIRQTFGAHADRLAVSSTKSLHGHALGAAGAIEAAATVLAVREQVVPPTANFTEPDPECDLDVVPNRSRPARLRAALSNSFAFGGLNAVLAFRRSP